MEKKIQIAVVLAALAAAVIVAVYLFTQSRKIEVIEKQEPTTVEAGDNKTETAEGERLAASANATDEPAEDDGRKAGQTAPDKDEPKPGEAGINATAEKSARQERRLPQSMVTPRFINDLASFVVDRYHPPKTVDNPEPQGTTTIDFKSLNARYGLELIGLRHSSSNLRQARQEILTFVMDPQVLRALYDQYGDMFVDSLVQKARQTEKSFLSPPEKRRLEERQIEEMLRLNAQYIDSVAEVFEVLGKNPAFPDRVESYLAAEKEAVHANFLLNQKQNELAVLRKELKDAGQTTQRMQLRLQKLKEEKEVAALNYKQAIQHREKVRQSLIQAIQDKAGQIRLETHEILYIAEWVHRRISEGENSPAILVGSDVLDDLAEKLRNRADQISS